MLQSIHFQDVGLCFKEILVKFTLILTLAKSGALVNSSCTLYSTILKNVASSFFLKMLNEKKCAETSPSVSGS